MEIKVDRKELISKLEILKKVIIKTAAPLWKCAYIHVGDDEVKMIANGLQIHIITYINAEVVDVNDVDYAFLDMEKAYKALKVWTDDCVSIRFDGKDSKISCGKKNYSVSYEEHSKSEWLKFFDNPKDGYAGGFSVAFEHDRFAKNIKKNMVSLSSDKIRPNLCHMNLSSSEDGVWSITATDCHTISSGIVGEDKFSEQQFNLSETICDIITSVKKDELNAIYFSASNDELKNGIDKFTVVVGGFVIFTKTEDLTFPNWRKCVPSNTDHFVTVNKNSVINFIKESGIIDSDYIKILLKQDVADMICQNIDTSEEYKDEVAVEHCVPFDDFSFGFKKKTLSDLLKTFDLDEIKFSFNNQTSPFIIYENDRLGLIMPCI